MENYGYSYPDSGDSSPRSREIDFENPPASWEDQPLPGNYKVKFMVSYGGKIQPRSHDNQLAYVGGETKIFSVDRNIKFSLILAKLSSICDGADINFKYQLPGEELDALISVTNDDDLEHMMHEYDRLYRGSAKPARLRLFLFPINQTGYASGSGEARSDRERIVDALNTVPVQAVPDSAAAAPPAPHPAAAPAANVDFLFGLEKGVGPGVVPAAQLPRVVKFHDPVPGPEFHVRDERITGSDPQIDARIQEINRLQIAEQQRQQMYRQKSDDNFVGGYAGEGYVQRLPEKLPPATIPATIQASVAAQTTYCWQPEKNVGSGGGFTAAVGHQQAQHQHQAQQAQHPHQQQQQVFMVPAQGGMYHTPAVVRPVNGQAAPAYYQVAQRMPTDVYREQQQVYNMVPPPMSSPPPPTIPSSLPLQPPKMAAPYAEGIGMPVRTMASAATSVGVTDSGYAQVVYDNVTGRQVYHYTAGPGGGVVTSPYQGVPVAAAVNADGRTAEGQTVPKVFPTSGPV